MLTAHQLLRNRSLPTPETSGPGFLPSENSGSSPNELGEGCQLSVVQEPKCVVVACRPSTIYGDSNILLA
jgi:hypothetical protein